MKVQFYGVRGSLPTPGKNTVIFGGNTSCVYVELNNGQFVILDAGTGIVPLGDDLQGSLQPINILLTHNHWDHIQGFPYFRPIFQPSRVITLIPGAVDFDDQDMVLKQMSGSNHPVKYHQLPAAINLNTQIARQQTFELADFIVNTQALNHPDGGSAYCLQGDGKKLVYVTDNELRPPGKTKTSWLQWVSFVNNADVLIHDAQYCEADLPQKHGWGHSTFEQVAELALEAKVKRLYFISHDPIRTDDELLAKEQELSGKYHDILKIECAREGCIIELGTS